MGREFLFDVIPSVLRLTKRPKVLSKVYLFYRTSDIDGIIFIVLKIEKAFFTLL